MKLSKPTLDVALFTADIAQSARFYGELLGFAEVRGAATSGRIFGVGGHRLELLPIAGAPRDRGGAGAGLGIRLLALIVDDLDAVLARLADEQVAVQKRPLSPQLPFRVAFSQDPDGNALELVGLSRAAGDAFRERLQIGLTVADVARTKQFYAEALGCPRQPEMRTLGDLDAIGDMPHAVTLGATTLKFWQLGQALPSLARGPNRRTGIRLIRASVESLAATAAELAARGVVVERHAQGGAGERLLVLDPDQNCIEFIEGPRAGVSAP